jgi:peptide deformylase
VGSNATEWSLFDAGRAGMTVLPIVLAPDPLLKQKSLPVAEITSEVRRLAADMFETMYASNGVGLSAVQVGVLTRLIVVDVEWGSSRYATEEAPAMPAKKGNPITMINPEIVQFSPELRVYDEGCLSFPAQYSEVERPDIITVEYMDLDGNTQRLQADGLLSTCIQHEIDHMNGVVFVDHISRIKRKMILRKVKKAQKLKEQEG